MSSRPVGSSCRPFSCTDETLLQQMNEYSPLSKQGPSGIYNVVDPSGRAGPCVLGVDNEERVALFASDAHPVEHLELELTRQHQQQQQQQLFKQSYTGLPGQLGQPAHVGLPSLLDRSGLSPCNLLSTSRGGALPGASLSLSFTSGSGKGNPYLIQRTIGKQILLIECIGMLYTCFDSYSFHIFLLELVPPELFMF